MNRIDRVPHRTSPGRAGKSPRFLRLAYVCFLFSGLTSLVTSGLELMAPDPSTATALFVMMGIPLMLVALATMLLGIVLAIQYANGGLLLLSAAAILFLVEMVGEYGSVAFYNASPVIYGFLTVAISGSCLLNLRARQRAG